MMFCSHCGKTVDSAAEKCPHCGAALGDNRLSGHTSVQARIVPADQASAEPARYTPYTKTTYTGEMDAGADVYSRTAYRPVLTEQPEARAGEAPEDSQAEAAAPGEKRAVDVDKLFKDKPVQLDEAQKAALQKLEAVPEDAPAPDEAQKIVRAETGIQVSPLKPIKKKGISPEVESYIQRMEAMKDKKTRKKSRRDDEEAPAQDAAQDDTQDAAEDAPEVRAPEKPKPDGSGGARRWIGRAAAILLIVVVIGGGLFYLAYITQPKSPIEGVTADLFDSGVALMKTRLTDTYRKEIVSLYQNDLTAQKVVERKETDRAEIQALLPSSPQKNDQTFVQTLLTIQDAVDAATATDALAAMTKTDATLDVSGESAQQWAIIQNYVLRLEGAKKLSDLNIVSSGVLDVMATPTPTPTPEVSQYQTLAKGAKSKQVKELQERMRDLGWFQGNVDGKYGTYTQTAIKYFQQAAGLTIDGIATPELQELLYSDEAPVKGADAAPTPAPTPAAQQ